MKFKWTYIGENQWRIIDENDLREILSRNFNGNQNQVDAHVDLLKHQGTTRTMWVRFETVEEEATCGRT